MHGIVVMNVLNQKLTMQIFAKHSKNNYSFVEYIEKLLFFLFYIF
jgi:hypothetical protein